MKPQRWHRQPLGMSPESRDPHTDTYGVPCRWGATLKHSSYLSTPTTKDTPTMAKLGVSTTLVSPVFEIAVRGTTPSQGDVKKAPHAPSMLKVLDVKAPLYFGALLVSLAGFCHAVAMSVIL